MLLQTLDAEELFADRVGAIPGRNGYAAPQEAERRRSLNAWREADRPVLQNCLPCIQARTSLVALATEMPERSFTMAPS